MPIGRAVQSEGVQRCGGSRGCQGVLCVEGRDCADFHVEWLKGTSGKQHPVQYRVWYNTI